MGRTVPAQTIAWDRHPVGKVAQRYDLLPADGLGDFLPHVVVLSMRGVLISCGAVVAIMVEGAEHFVPADAMRGGVGVQGRTRPLIVPISPRHAALRIGVTIGQLVLVDGITIVVVLTRIVEPTSTIRSDRHVVRIIALRVEAALVENDDR